MHDLVWRGLQMHTREKVVTFVYLGEYELGCSEVGDGMIPGM